MRATEFTQQSVLETFDAPYTQIRWAKKFDDGQNYEATTQLNDGSTLQVLFLQDYDDEGEGIYSIEFSRNKRQDITNQGDSQKIFATVLKIIGDFILKKDPYQVYFSATKDVKQDQNSESRAKLYTKLVKRYADMYDYNVEIDDYGFKVYYRLTNKTKLNESLYIDVPNEDWLDDNIKYAKSKGRDSFGAPYFGKMTAKPTEENFYLPVNLLKHLPGLRAEQDNVRKNDLAAIMKIMDETGKLPLTKSGKEYKPFIVVAHNGEAWVNEGNHRIMAADKLGWKKLPVELKYYDGGERIERGPLYPRKIGLA